MSDTTFDKYQLQLQAHSKLEAEALPRNKAAVFDALQSAGVATVTVEFEGSGDSGQMEKPSAQAADESVMELPSLTIEFERVDWTLGVRKEPMLLGEAIETLAWTLLSDTHGGWENNDGGYGTFTLTVADATITLEYNERYTETNSYEHEF